MADVIKIDINPRQFYKQYNKLMKDIVLDGPEVRKALKESVVPWKTVINSSFYKYVDRKTGKLGRAMGISSFYSRRRYIYGGKVRPIPLRKNRSGAGWRAHFFASPARQIRRGKMIPFQSIYSTRTPKVLSLLKTRLDNIFKKY
jgi:hypothetical protein